MIWGHTSYILATRWKSCRKRDDLFFAPWNIVRLLLKKCLYSIHNEFEFSRQKFHSHKASKFHIVWNSMWILTFSIIFVLLKLTCLVTLFNRNIEWDFFCDFQRPCRQFVLCLKNSQVFVQWFCHGMRKIFHWNGWLHKSWQFGQMCMIFVKVNRNLSWDFESRPWNQFWLEFHLTNQSHF